MDIDKIIEMQREFDRSHGFPFQFESEKNKYLQISKDLIGLMGEIGEFANLIKKINLAIDKCEQPISQIIDLNPCSLSPDSSLTH